MKKLVIMRGLPGSGKTTRAVQLAGDTGKVFSADRFFIDSNGIYHFNPKLLGEAHEMCKYGVAKAMESSTPVVVVDNTNSRRWEFEPYLEMAKNYGYEVTLEMVGNLEDAVIYQKRGIHDVPLTSILNMAKRWEK